MGTEKRRTQTERDAATVEIAFAFVTGAVLAGAVFVVCALPVFSGAVEGSARTPLLRLAAAAAAVAFCARAGRVLWRFGQRRREVR
ncbi:hypothetical protein G3I40_21920 [Streptomyces sp. SID14478]|nr:hypothetical protein [Streptomyces sp. SID14478]